MSSRSRRLYCTVKEAAHLLDSSPAKVYRLISSGYLPAKKVGPRLLRIPEEELKRFISERDRFFADYYSYEEAAARLGVTIQSIEKWVYAGRLGAHKFATFPTGVLKEDAWAIDPGAARQIPKAA